LGLANRLEEYVAVWAEVLKRALISGPFLSYG
jgi:hypothetical protein